MQLSKKKLRMIVIGLHSGIQSEEALIDAYSNVHDGSEKAPIAKSTKFIKKWKEIIYEIEHQMLCGERKK